MYGSYSELVAQGVDPNQLLGLINSEKKDKDRDQFLIIDEQEPDTKGIDNTSHNHRNFLHVESL